MLDSCDMPNPYILLAFALALIANGFYWHHSGYASAVAEYKVKLSDAKDKAREQEQMWQGVVNGTVANFTKRETTLRNRLSIALDSLRTRPDRLPDDSRPACQGSTGAELSRQDGEFLSREAARAESIRGGLEACYEYIDALKK